MDMHCLALKFWHDTLIVKMHGLCCNIHTNCYKTMDLLAFVSAVEKGLAHKVVRIDILLKCSMEFTGASCFCCFLVEYQINCKNK